jgi:hypothetical protein
VFECSLPCFLLLFISFESILTKVSFQYVQKLLHFVYLLILTLNLFSIGVQGLYVQDYGKLWQARFESHEANCFHTWTYVMDFHASNFGPFYFWKFEFWTLKDLHGFKTLFWKYWSFSCYVVDKKKLSQSNCFQYMWNFDISWWMFGKYFKLKFSINGGLHPNISLYHEIGTNMNKLIIS